MPNERNSSGSWRPALKSATSWPGPWRKNNQYYLGWTWHKIPLSTQKLRVLVEEGVFKVNYQSNRTITYVVQDPEMARQALDSIGDGDDLQEGQLPPVFDYIVAHDEDKYWL